MKNRSVQQHTPPWEMTHRVLAGTSSTLRAPNFSSVLLGISNLDSALWARALARRRESMWRPLWTPRLSCTRHVLWFSFTEMTVYGPINSGANLLLSGFRAHTSSLIWNVTYFLSSCSQTRLSPCSEAFDRIAKNSGDILLPWGTIYGSISFKLFGSSWISGL